MIIGRDLMIQLGLIDDFKQQVLQWDGATVHMKEPRNLLGQSDLTKRKICEVAIQTAEPASNREATERMVKILENNYAKSDLENVVGNASHLNAEEMILLLSLLKDFEDLFDITLVNWATEPAE